MRRSRGFLRRQLQRGARLLADCPPPGTGRRRRPADRDPNAEAWIIVGAASCSLVADRLGGLLDDEDFAAIAAQRLRWLSGAD